LGVTKLEGTPALLSRGNQHAGGVSGCDVEREHAVVKVDPKDSSRSLRREGSSSSKPVRTSKTVIAVVQMDSAG